MKDTQKETEFYKKPFKFSYSSLNKLLFSPSLFYKDYILQDREEKIEKYLIEGRLIHCLLFEPDSLTNKFKVIPERTPTDNIRKVLYRLYEASNAKNISYIINLLCDDEEWTNLILQILKENNLYQSLKADSARLAKIQTNSNVSYWSFISNSLVDVIDVDTLNKCKGQVDVLMENNNVAKLLVKSGSDFALDPITSFTEKKLECELKDYIFGLKGIVDHYEINTETKEITICDLKTTSKSIKNFAETVDFYNYWLQAAVYSKLVFENHKKECDNYKILFKFIVIDRYKQVYIFDVSDETLSLWANEFTNILHQANHHYTNNNYSLPYAFLTGKITL